MCGIYLYRGDLMCYDLSFFQKLKNRGPDVSRIDIIDNIFFGFHRLSINDTTNKGMQPFIGDEFVFVCNGEIYNYEELSSEFSDKLLGKSDCEVIPYLILK